MCGLWYFMYFILVFHIEIVDYSGLSFDILRRVSALWEKCVSESLQWCIAAVQFAEWWDDKWWPLVMCIQPGPVRLLREFIFDTLWITSWTTLWTHFDYLVLSLLVISHCEVCLLLANYILIFLLSSIVKDISLYSQVVWSSVITIASIFDMKWQEELRSDNSELTLTTLTSLTTLTECVGFSKDCKTIWHCQTVPEE